MIQSRDAQAWRGSSNSRTVCMPLQLVFYQILSQDVAQSVQGKEAAHRAAEAAGGMVANASGASTHTAATTVHEVRRASPQNRSGQQMRSGTRGSNQSNASVLMLHQWSWRRRHAQHACNSKGPPRRRRCLFPPARRTPTTQGSPQTTGKAAEHDDAGRQRRTQDGRGCAAGRSRPAPGRRQGEGRLPDCRGRGTSREGTSRRPCIGRVPSRWLHVACVEHHCGDGRVAYLDASATAIPIQLIR